MEAYSALHQAVFANHLRSRLDAGQGEVYGIAVSPDGTRLATIGTDRILKVWRLNGATIEQPPLLAVPDVGLDGVQLDRYPGFANPLLFSPDGRYLATVNNSSEIQLLDSSSGELAGRVDLISIGRGTVFVIWSIAFVPGSSSLNGYRLVAVTWAGIYLVELGGGSGSLLGGQAASTENILSIAIPPNGKLLTGGWDEQNNGQVKLWDLPTQLNSSNNNSYFWDQTLLAGKAGDPVYFIALSPDGRQLVYATNNEAHILDLTWLASGLSQTERFTIPFETAVTDIFYLPGGDRLGSIDLRGRVTLWDAKTGQPLFKLKPELPPRVVAVSPINQDLFTAHNTGEICSWDVAAPGSPEWLAVPTGGVRSGVALSQNGVDLLTWNITEAGLGIWEFSSWHIDGQQVLPYDEFTVNTTPYAFNYSYYFGPTRVVIGENSVNGYFRIHNALTGELVKEIIPGIGVTNLILNSDGSRVYFARSYGTVDAWDVETAQQMKSFRVIPEPGLDVDLSIALSSDDTLLLTWGQVDKVVRLWNAGSGQLVREFSEVSATVCEPALTPDNRFLLNCGPDHTVLIWEVATGKLVRSIPLPGEPMSVEVSPDGRYLVAGLYSFQTAVFDFTSGRELAVLPGTSTLYERVIASQFSPESKYLMITFPGDHAAYGFILDNNELVQLACQRLAAITLPGADGVVPQLPICATASE